MAGINPTASSRANENIVEIVTSPSPEGRGISSGSSSPITTATASAQNANVSKLLAPSGSTATSKPKRATPSAITERQKT